MTDLAAQTSKKKMRITLLPVAQSPHIARTFVRHALLDLRMPDLVEDASVIASELVANAVKHVPQAEKYELTFGHTDSGALIQVWDPSPKPPVIVNLPDAEFGRGLHIVNALASMWSHYILPPGSQEGGKIVWALLGRKK
jgi:two-component sensor histidine kinase